MINHELVNASGKMMVLERLLDELFERGHKVLVFSQFVTMLDVIEVCVIYPLKLPIQVHFVLWLTAGVVSSLDVGLGNRVQRLAALPHRRFDERA